LAWPHPSGLYGIGAQFVSGVPTSYTFNIFEYGQPVEMFYFDANGDFVKSTQMTSTLSPGEFGSAIAAIRSRRCSITFRMIQPVIQSRY